MVLSEQVTELDLPVYFLEAAYDYTCNYDVAKDYFEKINAPIKGFYTFENSSHSPVSEEPERAAQILREDVLKGLTNLADQD
jgi:pimeloyl-ACP methyl ester carboxylesterase